MMKSNELRCQIKDEETKKKKQEFIFSLFDEDDTFWPCGTNPIIVTFYWLSIVLLYVWLVEHTSVVYVSISSSVYPQRHS